MNSIAETIRKFGANHPIYAKEESIFIGGYSNIEPEACFCSFAQGSHYEEFGIADNSMLFCCKSEPPKEGDLVISYTNDIPTVYIFQPGANTHEAEDGKRIIGDPEKIFATIIGSFSFYR